MAAGLIGLVLATGSVGAAGIEKTPQLPEGSKPVRIIRHGTLHFPADLKMAGVSHGEVRVILDVDRQGKLDDYLIVAYTHFSFANELSRNMPRWRYEPAMVGGQAIGSTIVLSVRFEIEGMVVTERRALDEPRPDPDAFMFRARELNELDRVPQILLAVPPETPPLTSGGRARVEFYIDERGDVRVPMVKSADDERLGWAALAAIEKWQFEIPMRGGHPVLAHASQVFVFKAAE